MEPYIDEARAAQIIGIKTAKLARLSLQKQITHIKVARGVRVYLESDLHHYMQHARRLAAWCTDAQAEKDGGFESTTPPAPPREPTGRRKRPTAFNATEDAPKPKRELLKVH